MRNATYGSVLADVCVLCVVPTRWPLLGPISVALHTWLIGCDRIVLGVSWVQLGASWRPVHPLNSSCAGASATHESHTSRIDIWLPVRASIQFAARHNMTGMDWLMLAEDDSYIVMPKLRAFLRPHAASAPHFFGACACLRSPGVNLFSSAGLQRLEPRMPACEPIHQWRDAPNHTGNGEGASDIAIHFCLAKAGLTCSQPLDEHGHMLMSVMASTPQKTLRRHVDASRGNRQFCARWPCSKRPGCWGAGTFAFHARPLKDTSMQWSLHSQLHQPTTKGFCSPIWVG